MELPGERTRLSLVPLHPWTPELTGNQRRRLGGRKVCVMETTVVATLTPPLGQP